jgi:lysophospholipase L1-like esterase
MPITPNTLTFPSNTGAGAKLADLGGVTAGATPWVASARGRYIIVPVAGGGWALLAGPAGFTPGAHTITINDGTNSTPIAVTVTNADTTPPGVISTRSADVQEGMSSSVFLSANEDGVTWSTLGGADTALFTLSGNILSLPGQAYSASKASYVANLRATDAAGNTTDFTYTVNVQKKPAAPSAGTTTPPPATLTGFYLNGAANPKLKAGFARVQAGTGRAKWVVKGDSTSVGVWAVEDGQDGVTNARTKRPAAKIAAAYTAAGIPMLDNSMIGDCSYTINGRGVLTETNRYDPRFSYVNFSASGDGSFAGAAAMYADANGSLSYALSGVDTFVMSMFGSGSPYVPTIQIDGAAPTSGPANAPGPSGPPYIINYTVKAAAVGTHTGKLQEPAGGGSNIRGMYAYNSAVAAWDILFHANNGATSGSQSASNGQWFNQESLAFDAPDFTTINLGINDQNGNVALNTYTANLQKIITTAKISGDVLLVFPHPIVPNAGTSFTQQQYHDAAKALAVSNGISFLSLYEYFGGAAGVSAVSARTHDGVHPHDDLYADIATAMKQAIDLMRAA